MDSRKIIPFVNGLSAAAQNKLPGLEAQFFMAPASRKENYPDLNTLSGYKASAVCLHFYEKDKHVCIPVIERAENQGFHSGQMALPGGKMDANDSDFIQCALRETEEEIGVKIHRKQVLGQLTSLYIPPSNFLVQPVMTWQECIPEFRLNASEINFLHELRLIDLLDETKRIEATVKSGRGYFIKSPGFVLNEKIIWGATAMILSELKTLIQNQIDLQKILHG